MKVDKFNTSWQLVRVNARTHKDVYIKIDYVFSFLLKEPNNKNYWRVHNWLRMTGFGYRGEKREVFVKKREELEKLYELWSFREEGDSPSNFNLFEEEDLLKIYKDLLKRSYWFQIKKIPIAHINYVEALGKYLQKKDRL